jgi:hypothetical protein
MKDFTFEDAKQQVAEKNGFKSWFWFMFFCPGILRHSRNMEAIELYARHKANEAVNDMNRVLSLRGCMSLILLGFSRPRN